MGELVKVGVEEEFLLIDGDTGRPAPRIDELIGAASARAGEAAQEELHRAQIETASEPCEDLGALAASLEGLRADMAEAAAAHGIRVVASGTYPGEMGGEGRLITAKPRYRAMADRNALVADEQLICGCHVHVSTEDRHAALRVANRLRRHLPAVAALAANSPYWQGRDSGFASFRTEVWTRWPSAGPPGRFADVAEYESVLDTLVDAGVILDRGMAYWDVRPSDRFPTVEIRVCDVALSVDDAVTVAGLIRALVVWLGDDPSAPDDFRPEWLRAANWLAARDGTRGRLLDPLDGRTAPAPDAVADLLERLSGVLDRLGDTGTVTRGVEALLSGGTGADRQRAAYASGGWPAVLDLADVSR